MRNQIITEVFNSKTFKRLISKMQPEHLQTELQSELMLLLCETEESKLIALYEKRELMFFISGVAFRMMASSTSKFYKTFRRVYEPLDWYEEGPIVYYEKDTNYVPKISWHTPELLKTTINIDEDRIVLRKALEDKQDKVWEFLTETMQPHDALLLFEYLDLGSYGNMSKATGIAKSVLIHKVSKTIKKIQEYVQ